MKTPEIDKKVKKKSQLQKRKIADKINCSVFRVYCTTCAAHAYGTLWSFIQSQCRGSVLVCFVASFCLLLSSRYSRWPTRYSHSIKACIHHIVLKYRSRGIFAAGLLANKTTNERRWHCTNWRRYLWQTSVQPTSSWITYQGVRYTDFVCIRSTKRIYIEIELLISLLIY